MSKCADFFLCRFLFLVIGSSWSSWSSNLKFPVGLDSTLKSNPVQSNNITGQPPHQHRNLHNALNKSLSPWVVSSAGAPGGGGGVRGGWEVGKGSTLYRTA